MNKKAEAFIKYLDDKKITCFAIEQISEDKLNTVSSVLTLLLKASVCRRWSSWTAVFMVCFACSWQQMLSTRVTKWLF